MLDGLSPISEPSVGPWARQKLELLRKYLGAYTTALSKQSWLKGTIYVDAFAGAGVARVRRRGNDTPGQTRLEIAGIVDAEGEELEYILGSPRVALEIARPFSRYVFVERDPNRAAALNAIKAEWADRRKITVYHGDASGVLGSELIQASLQAHGLRALVFLDPYGMQVEWPVVEQLGRTKAIEVIVNFPLGMAIQRLMTRSGKISTGNLAKLDAYFGSDDWHSLAYEADDDLVGPWSRKARDANRRVLGFYCERLKQAFGYVSPPRLIRNTRNGHLYHLIWAGPHPIGAKIASDVFR